MVEKLEGTGQVYEALDDDGPSGIRTSPWIAQLRAVGGHDEIEPRAGALLGGLVAEVGARVLGRFNRLTREDHGAVFDAAIARLTGTAERAELSAPNVEARVAHAVLCAAIPLDLRRWVEEVEAPPAEVGRELMRACRRASALTGRERSVFFAVCALDDVAEDREGGKVVLRAAVAYQMRWNTAHQNVSRAWRKICEGSALGSWCRDWRAGHRFVCGPPPLQLWVAGRAYMDACSGREGHGGEAFEAWVEAHEAHNAWFSEWKKQSGRAARCWRDLATSLDGSGRRPGAVHAPLVQSCAALGIDRWVIPAKLAQQSWRDVLDAAHRPAPSARDAWLAFLRDNGFGPEPEAAFRELERTATLAEVASVEVEHAYRRLLVAADGQSSASLRARDAFRGLIDGADATSGGER